MASGAGLPAVLDVRHLNGGTIAVRAYLCQQ